MGTRSGRKTGREQENLEGSVPTIIELAGRMREMEEEIRRIKTLLVGSISPPTTQFEKTIDLSLRESEPFFREITRIMREETATTSAKGIALLAGLYEDQETDQRAWFASRQSIQALLPREDRAFEEASALAKSLANTTRLRILAGLCYGPRRFGELVAITGTRGGQLTHHLEPLLSHGLIHHKEDRYSLTTKGWESLLALLLASQTKAQADNTQNH